MTETALDQFHIIDLSSQIPGPFCTKLFADHGADVIKVEPPGVGDMARTIGPFHKDDPHPEKSLTFFYLNSNKRSVTLNLESAAGRNILKSLVKKADALIESYPPGYMDELGLGYQALEKINPQLVMTSITPFGQTGPYRDAPGNDLIYEAMGGIMYVSGAYDREPLKHGQPQSLYIGGVTAAYATSVALFARTFLGQGQHVDLSLREGVAAHHHSTPVRYSFVGGIERRAPKDEAGSPKGGAHFEGIVPVKDGYVGATFQRGVSRDSLSEYVKMLGHPELQDTDFSTPQLQGRLPKDKDRMLLSLLKEWGKYDYFNTAGSNSWVASVVQTSEDLVNNPHLDARGYFTEVEHPVIGKIKMPGEIFRLTESPWSLRRPAPLLGQHNQEVYCGELDFTTQDLVRLRQQGVI